MTAFTRICPICAKFVGGINPVSHARCSKQLQQIHLNDKRRKPPKKLTVRAAEVLSQLILKAAA